MKMKIGNIWITKRVNCSRIFSFCCFQIVDLYSYRTVTEVAVTHVRVKSRFTEE